MQTLPPAGAQQPHPELDWTPTIGLAVVHFLIAMVCAGLAIANVVPQLLGLFGMAVFGVVAVLCVILTLTR